VYIKNCFQFLESTILAYERECVLDTERPSLADIEGELPFLPTSVAILAHRVTCSGGLKKRKIVVWQKQGGLGNVPSPRMSRLVISIYGRIWFCLKVSSGHLSLSYTAWSDLVTVSRSLGMRQAQGSKLRPRSCAN
jgi:hypothetical protein